MKLGIRPILGTWIGAALVALGPLASTARADEALPVVFVHGFSGSAQQYETQALRWASNDYPKPVTGIDRLFVGFSLTHLDQFIDALLAETGDSQVYVVAHSAGTAVMTSYLNGSPERAARVAKYIGIDGASNATCPGGVPCMGVWARGPTTRMVGPDHNVYLSEQGHTQSVTSPESFAAQYEFLTGSAPETTLILPERPRDVEIAGRALNFPNNTGMDGALLQLWEANPLTGERLRSAPEVTQTVDATGNFGPWSVNPLKRYEISVTRQAPDGPRYQHFYFEPWIRSDYLVRLNISPIGSALSEAIRVNSGPHAGASISRQKEWWGNNDVDATNVDVLEVTTSVPVQPTHFVGRLFCLVLGTYFPQVCDIEALGNIATPGTAPYAASTIAMIAFDVGADGVSDTSTLVNLGPFLSGIDAYMPAPHAQPNGVVTFHLDARREPRDQVIQTPNWPMDGNHFMSVVFREWTQNIETWAHCRIAKLCN